MLKTRAGMNAVQVVALITLMFCLGCHKPHAESMAQCNGITGKWKLVGKSGDGTNWQGVPAAQSHSLEFSGGQTIVYADNTSTCPGTYTLDSTELVVDIQVCASSIFFSQKIMLQNASTLIFRPNSGAILPYTKYERVGECCK
jgi:hypothetical protein